MILTKRIARILKTCSRPGSSLTHEKAVLIEEKKRVLQNESDFKKSIKKRGEIKYSPLVNPAFTDCNGIFLFYFLTYFCTTLVPFSILPMVIMTWAT